MLEGKNSISVIVPVYNGSFSLPRLHTRLSLVLQRMKKGYEIIFVNDGSKDDSLDCLLKIQRIDPRVMVINLERNAGQQHATLCGMRYARGKYIVTIDDDLQYSPEDIPRMFDVLQKNNYDLVYGRCREKEYAAFRYFGSLLRNLIFKVMFRLPGRIQVTSFKMLRREITMFIAEESRPFVYLSASILNCTRNIGMIDVECTRRRYGVSGYSFFRLAGTIIKLILYYSVPLDRLMRLCGSRPSRQYEIKKIYEINE